MEGSELPLNSPYWASCPWLTVHVWKYEKIWDRDSFQGRNYQRRRRAKHILSTCSSWVMPIWSTFPLCYIPAWCIKQSLMQTPPDWVLSKTDNDILVTAFRAYIMTYFFGRASSCWWRHTAREEDGWISNIEFRLSHTYASSVSTHFLLIIWMASSKFL